MLNSFRSKTTGPNFGAGAVIGVLAGAPSSLAAVAVAFMRPRIGGRSAGFSTSAAHGVSLGDAMRAWRRMALLSFGGPAGQMAVMHRILVDEKKWVSESRFMQALNFCMLLPGPEAQQLTTYMSRNRPWKIFAG